MKRITAVLILFALLVSLLVSCTGEEVSAPESEPASEPEATESAGKLPLIIAGIGAAAVAAALQLCA